MTQQEALKEAKEVLGDNLRCISFEESWPKGWGGSDEQYWIHSSGRAWAGDSWDAAIADMKANLA